MSDDPVLLLADSVRALRKRQERLETQENAHAHDQYALLAGRAGGQALSGGTAANDDLILQGTSHATRASSYMVLQPNGGNVGIGISSPADRLQVAGGNVLLDNAQYYRGKTAAGGAIELLGIDGSNNVYMGAIANAGGKVIIREDGADVITLHGANVGIGTSSPADRLQVAGGNVLLDNAQYYRGKTAAGSAIELLGIDGSNNVYIGAIANAGGKVIIREDGADVITLHGANVGIGTSTPNDTLDTVGTVAASGASATIRAYDRANGAAHAFGLYVASNIGRIYSWGKPGDVLAFNESGQVSVGTSAPSYRLHVEDNIAGDANVAYFCNPNTAAAARSGSILLATATYAHTYLRQNGGSGTQSAGGAVDTILMNTWTTNDNGHLHIGTNNTVQVTVRHDGKVGIGTTGPGDKLHVSGGYVLLDNDYYLRVKNTSGTAIRVAGMDSANNVWLGAIDNAGGALYIREDGSTVITVTGGSVGINAGTPGAKLEIGGNVLIGNANYYYVKNSSGTSIPLIGIDGSNHVYLGAINNAGGNVYIREDGSDVIVLSGQNIGLGTSTLSGNAKVTVGGRVGVNTGVNNVDAQMFVYQSDSNAAVAVLDLAQEDVSEEFVNFRAANGTGNPIDTAALGTYYGKVRVSINGTFKWLAVYN